MVVTEQLLEHRMANLADSFPENSGFGLRLDNTYSLLPKVLFVAAKPLTVQRPRLSILNERLSEGTRHQLC